MSCGTCAEKTRRSVAKAIGSPVAMGGAVQKPFADMSLEEQCRLYMGLGYADVDYRTARLLSDACCRFAAEDEQVATEIERAFGSPDDSAMNLRKGVRFYREYIAWAERYRAWADQQPPSEKDLQLSAHARELRIGELQAQIRQCRERAKFAKSKQEKANALWWADVCEGALERTPEGQVPPSHDDLVKRHLRM